MNFSIFTNTSPMALSSTLRFSSSFFVFHNHCRHARFLSSPRRFLSFPPSRPPPSSRTPILASKDEERNGNGSVATVGPNVSPRIVPVELHEEMTGSYITYSMSVLLGRALPDVRDGLKPVHRRILWASFFLELWNLFIYLYYWRTRVPLEVFWYGFIPFSSIKRFSIKHFCLFELEN